MIINARKGVNVHPLLLGVLDEQRRTEYLGECVINVLISQFSLEIL